MHTYFLPKVNLMGAGCVSETGKHARAIGGTKALIVSDKTLVEIGITQKIVDILRREGIESVIYDEVSPNPSAENVHHGVRIFREADCDMIVAVGGGSPIDCAKGIGLVATNGGSIKDFEGLNKSKYPIPHFIAVNTTAGTASEMTRFTIITDTDRHVKMAIVDWYVMPTISVNDPELMVSMPAPLTAATGMDALTRAVEAYVSTLATPITDAAAMKAIEIIGKYLRPAVANGQNLEARKQMAFAQFMAGMAFNNASLGHVHAMAHQLGGYYDLPQGVCNAILLPEVSKFNMVACPERFADIAVALGENTKGLSAIEAAGLALESIQRLSRDVGIPRNLSELGVRNQDLILLAGNARKDACSMTNPRLASHEDIIRIYKNAM